MLTRISQADRLLAVFQGAGLIGCAASTYLTINLCAEAKGDMGWVTIAIGAMLEACKYSFAIRGTMLWDSHRARALALYSVSAALVLGSITASLGYLVEADRDRSVNRVRDSVLYQAVSQQMASTHNSIVVTENVADKYTNISYNAKALSALERNDRRQDKYMALAEKLHRMEEDPDAALPDSAMLTGVGAMGGMSGTEMRTWLYSAIAILLEVCSIFALTFAPSGNRGLLWLLTGKSRGTSTSTEVRTRVPNRPALDGPGTRNAVTTAVPTPYPEPVVPKVPRTSPVPGESPVPKVSQKRKEKILGTGGRGYSNFLKYVRSLDGEVPVRAVMANVGIGQEKATSYLKRAAAEGELEQVGNRYRMANPPVRRDIHQGLSL